VREKWLLAEPVSCLTRDFGILLTTIARPLEDEDASVYVPRHPGSTVSSAELAHTFSCMITSSFSSPP
jgi:hypothetical protein